MYRKNMVLPTFIFLLLIAFSLTPPIALGAAGPIQVTVGKSTVFNIKDKRLLGVVYARINPKTASNTLQFNVSTIKGPDCKPLSKCTRLAIAASRSAVPGLYKIDLLDVNKRLIGNYGLRVNKRIAALATTQKKIAATTPTAQQKSTSISRQSFTKKRLNASLKIRPGQTRTILLKNRSALNAIKYQVIPKTASRYFKISLKKVFGKVCGTQSQCMQAQVVASRRAVAGDYSLSFMDASNRKVGTAQIKVSAFTAQKAPTPLSKAPTLLKKKTGTANLTNRTLPNTGTEPKTILNKLTGARVLQKREPKTSLNKLTGARVLQKREPMISSYDTATTTPSIEPIPTAPASPDFWLENPISTAQTGHQRIISSANDGIQHLVLWVDNFKRLQLAMVNSQGSIVSKHGPFSWDVNQNYVHSSKVVFGSSVYLLVYIGKKPGAYKQSLNGVRIGQNGTPIGVPFIISDNENINSADVTFDGTNFVVAYSIGGTGGGWSGSGSGIFAARINTGGTLVDSSPINIFAEPSQLHVAVDSNGQQSLVIWNDARNGSVSQQKGNIVVKRLNSDGTVSDTSPIQITSDNRYSRPSISHIGTKYLVAYNRLDPNQATKGSASLLENGTVVGARIDFSGLSPRVINTGSEFIVSYAHGGGKIILVNTSGTVLGNPVEIHNMSTGLVNPPVISWAGGKGLAAWNGNTSAGSDVFMRRISTSGTFLDSGETLVSTGFNSQSGYSVTGNGDGFLVTWVDNLDMNQKSLQTYQVRSDGTVNFKVPVATAPSIHCGANAVGSTKNLVVWMEGSSNSAVGKAVRISNNGTILDSNPITLPIDGKNMSCPAVSYDGSNFVVAWSVNREQNKGLDISAVRISEAGTLLNSSAVQITNVNSDQSGPQIASTSNGVSLIAWTDSRGISQTGKDIGAARVDSNLNILDANGGFPVSLSPTQDRSPRIASDGTRFFVVWEASQDFVMGAMVEADGTISQADIEITSPVSTRDWHPDVTFDGERYFVGWEDQVPSGSPFVGRKLAGTWVNTNGTLAGIPAESLIEATEYLNGVRLASSPDGQVMIFYIRSDVANSTIPSRINGRPIPKFTP